MLRELLAPLSVTAAGLSQLAAAQDVFAHVIVSKFINTREQKLMFTM